MLTGGLLIGWSGLLGILALATLLLRGEAPGGVVGAEGAPV